MATAEVKRHWGRVAAMGCIITHGPAEIAHCHGGSIVERMGEPKARGKKLPRMDWLVLPLATRVHRTDPDSLDLSVARWEARYGLQADHIDRLCSLLGIDLWAKAREGKK